MPDSDVPRDASMMKPLTADMLDAWMIACEEITSTGADHEDDGRYTRAKAIRYVVSSAMSQVNDIIEGLR